MTYANTTLLGLNQPTTGSESGVWGDDVNNGFTALVDISVAGTNNITQDSDITLTITNGTNSSSFSTTGTNSTVAQYAVLNLTGSRTAARNVIAPAYSKVFLVTNATTGGYSITIKKTGGTGIVVANGETCIVYYNVVSGDYAKGPSNVLTAASLSGTVSPVNGGTGVTNNVNNTITFTGAYSLGLTLTNNSSITLPVSGTVATKGNAIAFSIVFGL